METDPKLLQKAEELRKTIDKREQVIRRIKIQTFVGLIAFMIGMIMQGMTFSEVLKILPTQTIEQNTPLIFLSVVTVMLGCIVMFSLYKAAISGGTAIGSLNTYDEMLNGFMKFVHTYTPEQLLDFKKEVDDEWRKIESEDKGSPEH